MIPTNCAACAAPLAHDAPKCARCKVRSISDCEEAVATLEDVIRISRRVCGTNHPTFSKAPTALESAREALARARQIARRAAS